MDDITLIPMVRDESPHPGGPVTADVHPDEVAGFEAGGWRRAEVDADADPADPAAEKPKRKPKAAE